MGSLVSGSIVCTKISLISSDLLNQSPWEVQLSISVLGNISSIKKGWPADMRPVMDVLQEAKRKGRIRAIGVSCHGWDPLVSAADAEGIDIHLVRINPFGAVMDGPVEDVAAQVKKMHQKGRGVIGMKIFGENGFGSKEKRLQSLKYVLGLGAVDAFTIGFTSPEQIDETLQLIEQALI